MSFRTNENISIREINLKNPLELAIFNRNTPSLNPWASVVGGGNIYNKNQVNMTCHSALMRIKEVKGLVTGFYPYKNEVWWNYLSNPDGIYKELFEIPGWELLKSNEDVIALRVPDDVFKIDPHPLVYSFLINSRVPSEKQQFIDNFIHLICIGVEKQLAYIMSAYFAKGWVHNPTALNTWSGSHQIFADNYCPQNFAMFLRKEYDKSLPMGLNCSKLWASKHTVRQPLHMVIKWSNFGAVSSTNGNFGSGMTKYVIHEDKLLELSEHIRELINERQ